LILSTCPDGHATIGERDRRQIGADAPGDGNGPDDLGTGCSAMNAPQLDAGLIEQ